MRSRRLEAGRYSLENLVWGHHARTRPPQKSGLHAGRVTRSTWAGISTNPNTELACSSLPQRPHGRARTRATLRRGHQYMTAAGAPKLLAPNPDGPRMPQLRKHTSSSFLFESHIAITIGVGGVQKTWHRRTRHPCFAASVPCFEIRTPAAAGSSSLPANLRRHPTR
jgi:hypothetical protein